MFPVELSGVTIRYGRAGMTDLDIVADYDLSLEAGRMHCLAGRSGSGKTSILRVAAGLARPTSGSVSWNGTLLDGLRDDAVTELRRTHLGYLDQGGVLVSGLSALENVLLPGVPGRWVRHLEERGRELLERLGVGERAAHRPEQLSVGERQRVALARALLLRPPVLMVDEPTAALDRLSADGVITLLGELASDGIAVLVASHDEHLIAASDSRTSLA